MRYIYGNPDHRSVHPGPTMLKKVPVKSSLRQPYRDDVSTTDADTIRSSIDRRQLRATINPDREREVYEYEQSSSSSYTDTSESKGDVIRRRIIRRRVYNPDVDPRLRSAYDDDRNKINNHRIRSYKSASRSLDESTLSSYTDRTCSGTRSTYSHTDDVTSSSGENSESEDEYGSVSTTHGPKIIRHITVPDGNTRRNISALVRERSSYPTQYRERETISSDSPSVSISSDIRTKRLIKPVPPSTERLIVHHKEGGRTVEVEQHRRLIPRAEQQTADSDTTDVTNQSRIIDDTDRQSVSSNSEIEVLTYSMPHKDGDDIYDYEQNVNKVIQDVDKQLNKKPRTVGVQMNTRWKIKRPEPVRTLQRRRDIQTQTMRQETKFPPETAYIEPWEPESENDDEVEIISLRKPYQSEYAKLENVKFVAPEMDYKQPITPSPPPTPPRTPTPPPLVIPVPPGPDVLIRVGGGWMKEEHHRIQHKPLGKRMQPTADGLPFLKTAFIHNDNKKPVVVKHKRGMQRRYASFIT